MPTTCITNKRTADWVCTFVPFPCMFIRVKCVLLEYNAQYCPELCNVKTPGCWVYPNLLLLMFIYSMFFSSPVSHIAHIHWVGFINTEYVCMLICRQPVSQIAEQSNRTFDIYIFVNQNMCMSNHFVMIGKNNKNDNMREQVGHLFIYFKLHQHTH